MSLISVAGVSTRLTGYSIRWALPDFLGYSKSTASSITQGTIYCNATSGDAPFLLHSSASAVTASGTETLTGDAINPYMHLDHRLTITYSDDSPIAHGGEVIDPLLRQSVSHYTDQLAGEAAFLLHEPGSYKLTLVSTSANDTTETTARTITVNVPTYAHKWFDPDNGNDSNDGRDVHGFDLSNASYTESSGELTEVGGFTNYDHAAATAQLYTTDNYHWVALNYGAAWHWHRIGSKVDNDTIVLLDKIGSDTSNITSSDGPKETFDYDDVEADTAHHLKVGSVSVTTASIDTEEVNGVRFMAWGGSGKATIRAGFSGDIFDITAGSNDSMGDRLDLHKAILDSNSQNGYTGQGIAGVGADATDTTRVNFVQDRCEFINSDADRNMNPTFGGIGDQTCDWLAIATYFDNRGRTNQAKQSNILLGAIDGSHTAMIGCTFSSSKVDTPISHHHLAYITGDHSHRVRRWCDSLEYVDANMFFNETCGSDPGDSVSRYTVIAQNRFRNCTWAADPANVNNDLTTGSTFADFVVLANGFDGTDSNMLGGIFYASVTSMFVGHNAGMNLTRGLVEPITPDSGPVIYIDGNLGYDCEIMRAQEDESALQFVNNITHMTGADVTVFQWNSTLNDSDTYIQDNQSYAPNDSDGSIYNNNAVGVQALAALNGYTNHSGNTESDPGWADPANGDFRA